ncbi:MAG: hypothetical protein J7L47_01010 [Candidatus Odinarchaeota archaeon]|nr:hypothetical protein [Candidatus Odinarchaeota archaeon]
MSEEILSEVLKELRELKERIEKLENLIHKRLFSIELPLQDETEAIREYEKSKKEETAEFISLEGIQKQ